MEHGAQTVADEDSSSGSDSEANTFDFCFNRRTEELRNSSPSFDELLGQKATGLPLSDIFDYGDLSTLVANLNVLDGANRSVEVPREITSLVLIIKGQRKWEVDLLLYKCSDRLQDTFNRRVRIVRRKRLDPTRGTPKSSERYAVAAVSI